LSAEAFLLSMQAAGAITDIYSTGQAIKIGRAGAAVEMEQFNTRLEQERLNAAMSSLDAMSQLRSVMASQAAMFAARGQKSGVGTAYTISAESRKEHSAGEKMRRMNLLTMESNLRAGKALTGMHQLASETKLGRELASRQFQNAPFAELSKQYEKIGKKDNK
jgi:hypothetical protein